MVGESPLDQEKTKNMQNMFGTIILVILLLGMALLAVGIIDGNRFVTVREEFALPGLSKECRFVLISDLHNKVYGNKNDKVIASIQEINPDFIILAGDLVTSQVSEDMTPGIELINTLSQKYKIYYGLGNHESKMQRESERFGGKFDTLMQAVSNKNVKVLQNESIDLPQYNIRLTGLDLALEYFAHFRTVKMEDGYLQEVLPEYDRTRCNLLIAHNPDYFDDYAGWGAQLVMCMAALCACRFWEASSRHHISCFPSMMAVCFGEGDRSCSWGGGWVPTRYRFGFSIPQSSTMWC